MLNILSMVKEGNTLPHSIWCLAFQYAVQGIPTELASDTSTRRHSIPYYFMCRSISAALDEIQLLAMDEQKSLQQKGKLSGHGKRSAHRRVLLALTRAPEEFRSCVQTVEDDFLSGIQVYPNVLYCDSKPLDLDSVPTFLANLFPLVHTVGHRFAKRFGVAVALDPATPKGSEVASDESAASSSKSEPGRMLLLRSVPHRLVPFRVDVSTLPIVRIGDDFFSGAKELVDLQLPTTLKVIGNKFLASTTRLRTLDLSHTQVETIGDWFLDSSEVAEVLFPESLVSLGCHGLAQSKLSSVDLSHTRLCKLGNDFMTESQAAIVTLALPSTLQVIGDFLQRKYQVETLPAGTASERPPITSTLDLRPSTLTALGDGFLTNWGGVTVLFPRTLTSIGNTCLVGAANLRVVDLSETNLTRVGSGFLRECTAVESVLFPVSLTSIGSSVLDGAVRLQSLRLDHTALDLIEEEFLTRCTALSELTLPPTLATIGTGWCRCCLQLKVLNLSHCTTLNALPKLFVPFSGIEEFLPPPSLKYLRSGSFANCIHFKVLNLAETCVELIDDNALINCGIEALYLPQTLKKIGDNALKNCSQLKEVDLSHTVVTEIGFGAFDECASLQRILFPPCLYTMSAAFCGCHILSGLELAHTKIERLRIQPYGNSGSKTAPLPQFSMISLPPQLKFIGNATLKLSSFLRVVDLSSTSVGEIGDEFLLGSAVEHVLFPPTLKELGHGVLKEAMKLLELDLSHTQLVSTGQGLLNGSGVTRVSFPPTLSDWGSDALAACKGVSSVDLSKTRLTRVAPWFLQHLKLDRLQLPSTLECIAGSAFHLTTFTGDLDLSGAAFHQARNNFFHGTVIQGKLILPSTLRRVDHCGFYRCRAQLVEFLDDSPPDLTPEASDGSLEATDNFFHESVVTGAIRLPRRLRKMRDAAFAGALIPASINFEDTHLESVGRSFFGAAFCMWDDDTPTLQDTTSRIANYRRLTFPSTLTQLGPNAFHSLACPMNFVVEVDLSATQLTELPPVAFRDSGITELKLPPSLTNVADRVLSGAHRLCSLRLEHTALTCIGNEFLSDSAIATVSFPPSLQEIGNRVFEKCASLTQLELGHTALSVIGNDFCKASPELGEVSLPSSLESIGAKAFALTKKLHELRLSHTQLLPDGSIGEGLGWESGLKKVEYPPAWRSTNS